VADCKSDSKAGDTVEAHNPDTTRASAEAGRYIGNTDTQPIAKSVTNAVSFAISVTEPVNDRNAFAAADAIAERYNTAKHAIRIERLGHPIDHRSTCYRRLQRGQSDRRYRE
jgi:hypothetical protein